jgi:histidinol-phosphate aminotransferase
MSAESSAIAAATEAAPGIRPSRRAASSNAYRRGAAASTRPDLLKLDANEGPLALLNRYPGGIAAITAEALREYPDVSALEDILCTRLAVSSDQLIVTAGGDDALARIAQAVIDPGDRAVATTPTFEMIPRYVKLAGGELQEVPWFDGAFPVEAVERACDEKTRAVFVVTPNNPTGGVATADDLRRLSAAVPGALLVVDLAYTEFADVDLTATALSLPNAIIVRTFSKAWGLAGLRVGYAVGPANVISWLRGVGQPYAVSAPSAAVTAWACRNLEDAMIKSVQAVKLERQRLASLLRAKQIEVVESQGNFVLFRTPRATAIAGTLSSHGIAARLFTGRPVLENCIRLTCPGDAAAFARVNRALEEIK